MSTVKEKLPIINLPIGQHHRGLGVLEVHRPAGKVLLPLAAVQISAKVADRVASVTVQQTFRNTFADHLEAVYIFPLSGGCVVSDFEIRVGSRIIKGKVKERQQARIDYQQALQDGKRAALLEQERDDVFTMQVGNIPPNEEILVQLTYSERLAFFENGKTEIRLPLVVAPRYIPGVALNGSSNGVGVEADTNLVPDASRISPPRLAKGADPQVALGLEVEIVQSDFSGGHCVTELSCSQHATQMSAADGTISVELSRTDERLNRDFVLSWRLATKKVKSSCLVHSDTSGSEFGMLSIVPPKRDGFLGSPRDVVFVVDRSGSMGGIKMISAARSCSLLLETLGPNDRFSILAFDDRMEWMLPNGVTSHQGQVFFPADEQEIERGHKYLRGITARGGTELDGALSTALIEIKKRSEADSRVPVVVLITDGEVGNEGEILKRVQKEIGDTRLFAIGVDTAVNSGLLRRIANLGGGTAAFVTPGTDLETALKSIGREIGEPMIVDLEVKGVDGLKIYKSTLAPANLPDLFAGRALTAFFKLSGTGAVRIRGRWSDGRAFDEEVRTKAVNLNAIAQLWAKAHIVDLEDAYRLSPGDALRKQIIELSELHSILTKFTAFVAVDDAEIVNKTGELLTMAQPVEEPSQWAASSWGAPTSARAMSGGAPRGQFMQLSDGGMDQVFTGMAGIFEEAGAQPQCAPPASAPAPAPAPAQAQPPAPGSPPPPAGRLKKMEAAKEATGFLENTLLGGLFRQRVGSDGFDGQSKVQRRDVSPEIKLRAEQSSVSGPLQELGLLLETLLVELRGGKIPDCASLESKRLELLQMLSALDCGAELPILQKFLRVQLKELVQSVKEQGVNAAGLLPLWERHMQVFKEAQNEATSHFAGVGPSGAGKGKFWESSI